MKIQNIYKATNGLVQKPLVLQIHKTVKHQITVFMCAEGIIHTAEW